MTKVLGLGHSHIVAIAKGCYELQRNGATVSGSLLASRFLYLYDPQITPTLVSDDGAQRLNPRLVDIIEQERAAFIILSVGGNEHIALSIIQPRERVDFVLGEEPDLPLESGAIVLSEAAVRETMREKMEPTLLTISAVRRVTEAPVFCLEPPPPLPDSQILAYPREFFRRAVEPSKLSSERFRYKMWRMQSSLYRETCAAHDIAFVSAPERFIESPGLLAREAWGGDATHANALFGRVMVERAISLLGA